MKILFLGDVVGRAAREAVMRQVPVWRKQMGLDFVIVNGENAAGGFGITPEIADGFFDAGVDVVSTGNHVWDQQALLGYIDSETRLLRLAIFRLARRLAAGFLMAARACWWSMRWGSYSWNAGLPICGGGSAIAGLPAGRRGGCDNY